MNVLTSMAPPTGAQAVLIFDNMINYREFAQGELKALCELLRRSGRQLRVLGTGASHVLPDAAAVTAAISRQRRRRETPHVGKYQQDAAFVLE